jgi:hypothetical protein
MPEKFKLGHYPQLFNYSRSIDDVRVRNIGEKFINVVSPKRQVAFAEERQRRVACRATLGEGTMNA